MSVTIDTAIAAWKNATTQADRDLAATAIREHIAHDTPEDAEYDSATDEFLDRLTAEFGPVPVEDLRGFHIALPAELCENEVEGIWGIGRSEELAIADAHHWTQTQPATVERGDNEWVIRHEGRTFRCQTREAADAHAATLGYRAERCTEALYDRVKAEGYNVDGHNSYRYALNGSLYDIVDPAAGDGETLPCVEGDDGKVLDSEDELPSTFTYYDGEGTEYAYRYLGQEQHEVRRWMPAERMWWVEPSEMISEDTTVEEFLVWKENA